MLPDTAFKKRGRGSPATGVHVCQIGLQAFFWSKLQQDALYKQWVIDIYIYIYIHSLRVHLKKTRAKLAVSLLFWGDPIDVPSQEAQESPALQGRTEGCMPGIFGGWWRDGDLLGLLHKDFGPPLLSKVQLSKILPCLLGRGLLRGA